jgi:hypothetical protein
MNEISVILNVFKRPHTLEQQIQAIKSQSIPIKSENIHVWYNRSEVQQVLPKDQNIKTYVCNWNTKFFGRFTIPLLCDTPYIAMFDDDVYPQVDWFKNCLETIQKPETNGVLGGSGVILKAKAYRPHSKAGWNGTHSDTPIRVDLVGHAWFFRQEWIKYLWYERPITWNNGEDIMFSYLVQKYGNINTFVPPHPEQNKNLWSSDFDYAFDVGNDLNRSSSPSEHELLLPRNMFLKVHPEPTMFTHNSPAVTHHVWDAHVVPREQEPRGWTPPQISHRDFTKG